MARQGGRAAMVIALLVAAAMPVRAAPVLSKLAGNVYQNLYGIAADQFGVYVTGATGPLRDFNDPSHGVIGRIALGGGKVTTLYDSSNYPTQSGHVTPLQIATDGNGNLVWSDPEAQSSTGSAMLSGTYQGAAANLFFSTCCGPAAFPGDVVGAAFFGNHIYFTDSASGGVGVDPSGSGSTQIGADRYGPDFDVEMFSQMTVTASRVYLADSAEQPTVDNSVAALLDRSSSAGTGIRFIAPGSGSTSFKTLTGKIKHPHGLVAVGGVLYVTTAHEVWKVAASGGAATVLLKSKQFVDLQGIAYYAGSLYIADDGNTYGPYSNGVADATSDKPGMVWKLALSGGG